MAKFFTRDEIIARLNKKVAAKEPILSMGCGSGLTATSAELGGADIIGVYAAARTRTDGVPTILSWLPYENVNEKLVEMAKEILPLIKETPVLAGMGSHDPRINLSKFVDQLVDLGFSIIGNEPFSFMYGEEFRKRLDKAGIGFMREVELIETVHSKGLFSKASVSDEYEAREMAAAGADLLVTMPKAPKRPCQTKDEIWAEACEQAEKMIQAARMINPNVFCLTHGGPFVDVPSAQYSLLHTTANGYGAGSSGEREPVMEAVCGVAKQFKTMKMG